MTANQTQFHAALVAAYADLFAHDPAYAYSASKITPAGMADKMLAASIAGTVSHEGEGIKRACRACGIPHTRKAVLEFCGYVAPSKAVKAVRPRKVMTLAPSHVQTAMTGVRLIQRAHELVTLEYTDGKREAALIRDADWAPMADDVMRIVSSVQAQRKTA